MTQVVMVTGSSHGIGRQIAMTLATQGNDLILCGRDMDALATVQEQVKALGRKAIAVAGDISDPQFVHQLVCAATMAFGRIDGLVNNAGMIRRTKTLQTPLAQWEQVLHVNLTSAFMVSQAVLPIMMAEGGGAIVNITSAAGVTPHPNAAPSYGASKAGLTYLTKHFAQEFADDHIRVNAVCCGPIESAMTDQWDDDYRAKTEALIPLKRLGTAEEVAEAVTFLLSEKASFCTGASVNVSGGKLMS